MLPTLVGVEPFPGWDVDPGQVEYTATALGPGGAGLCAALQVVSAGLLIAIGAWRGRVRWVFAIGGLVAAAGPMVHALVLHAGDPEDVRIALSWSGAFAGAGAIASVARARSGLPLALGIAFLVVPVLLAGKGLLQVTVEHELTVASFREGREAFLASRGWAEGSAQALQFERRLNQPDPTAWFGLVNVLATFLAAAGVACLGWAIEAITARKRLGEGLPNWHTCALVASAVLLLITVVVAGSKGGFGAVGFGVLALASVGLVGRRTGPWRAWGLGVIGVLAIGLPLGGVVARGLLGERFDELSLLFRSFYLDGSLAVIRESLPWGTGPNGFKAMYAMLKPELAPEDVVSPHSVLFDYAATLGVLGIGGIALVLLLSIVPGATGRVETDGGDSKVPLGVFGALALCVLVATQIEGEASTIEGAMTRLASLGGAAALGWVLWKQVSSGVLSRTPFVAAGLVVAMHSQIEMTLSNPQAVGLGLCLMAIGVCPGDVNASAPGPVRRYGGVGVGGVLAVAGALLLAQPVQRLNRLTTELRDLALEQNEMLARVRAFRASIEAGTATPEQDRALTDDSIALIQGTAARVSRLLEIFPEDIRLHRVRQEQLFRSYDILRGLGRGDDALVEAFAMLEYAREMTDRIPNNAEAWSLLARTRLAVLSVEELAVIPSDVAEAYERAAQLDPKNPMRWVRLTQMYVRYGDMDRARDAARRALETSDLRRLDPLTQLPEELERELRVLFVDSATVPPER